MKNIFSGKNVIVTGGASGIGAELVKRLIAFGATVVVVGRSKGYDGPARYFSADMSVQVEAERVFNEIITSIGDLDYVINSAGIFMGGEIRDTPFEDWHKVIDNNIYAVSHGAQLAYQYMLQRNSGHIINVASTAGLIPVPAMGIYGSTKYMLVGLSHAMRNEAKELGVKVSVACPTIVDTPLYDTAVYNKLDASRILKRRKKLQTPAIAADKILKGIVRNKATIHTSAGTHAIWVFYRLFPGLYDVVARRIVASYRSSIRSRS